MFKLVFTFTSITGVLIMSWITAVQVQGQDQVQDVNRLQQQSAEKFRQGDFGGALEGFNIMRDIQPGNALYAYYAGACMVEMNREVEDAIELLYGAAKRDVPPSVHYYLGLAYQRIYQFREARESFRKFESNATRQELKQYDIEKLISDCESARELTSRYHPYEVLNVTFMDIYDSVQFSQVRMKGGQLSRKPWNLFSEEEDREGITSLMFLPASAARGEYAYFAGYHRSGRGGSQLYRVRMGPGRVWGDPEEIKILNTDRDELLPYFDPIERDLYFASNGRKGIGGLDLYRSHYDQERDQWSEPINLGFPINSVMDEFLLLPGSDLGMVMFFTSRQSTDSTIAIYRVHVSEPKREADPEDNRMLMEIASLGGVAEEVLADLEMVNRGRRSSLKNTDIPENQRQATATGTSRPVTGLVTGKSGSGGDYQAILAGALRHQAVSDSLKDLATEARMKVRESDDPNDRWVWQKQIMVWEKKARDEEEQADLLYAQLGSGSMGTGGISGMKSQAGNRNASIGNREIPGVTRKDTVMGNMVVYRYDDAMITATGEPGDDPLRVVVEPGTKTGGLREIPATDPEPEINRFDILENSPYSASSPIPMDVEIPSGTYYRIQLGAFSTPVSQDSFSGISPITGETMVERGIIKYYAGKFSRYADASLALTDIRSMGYEDAFIVSWYNGVKVTTGRAKQLEQ
jgi:tetratricopeptide (TPR) repeat protein